MNRMSSFSAQTWSGKELVSEIKGLSYDAALHVAQSATLTGHVGRAMSDSEDWCAVYRPGQESMMGTLAETTLVRYFTDRMACGHCAATGIESAEQGSQ